MKVTLVSGRTVKQGTSLEIGKTSSEYFDSVAVVMMNEADMKEIDAKDGEPVEISTKFGSTVVRCKKSNIDRGIAFMPYGPWANMVVREDTQSTGMPDSKNFEVEISVTDKKVPKIADIVELIRRR